MTSSKEKHNIQKNIFNALILISGIGLAIYSDRLLKDINAHKLPMFYIYLRIFLIFWVFSSIIISLFGETKKIGGLKSFFICLFNPALGLIMVMASESKKEKNRLKKNNKAVVNIISEKQDESVLKQHIHLKQHIKPNNNKAYSLNG